MRTLTLFDLYQMTEEELDELSDEELDELYRPKKVNSRKSMLPLFVYLILQKYSDAEHPLTQKQILELLEKKHEITVERKALSRCLHLLVDDELGIFSAPTGGTWMER